MYATELPEQGEIPHCTTVLPSGGNLEAPVWPPPSRLPLLAAGTKSIISSYWGINYFKLLGSGPPEGLSRRTQEARASDKDSGNASSDSHQILIQIVTKEYRSLPTVDMENLTSIQERRAVPSRAWHVCIHPPAPASPRPRGTFQTRNQSVGN